MTATTDHAHARERGSAATRRISITRSKPFDVPGDVVAEMPPAELDDLVNYLMAQRAQPDE